MKKIRRQIECHLLGTQENGAFCLSPSGPVVGGNAFLSFDVRSSFETR